MKNKQNLLVDLDCLLDTKIGVLNYEYPKKVTNERLKKYSERNHNFIGRIFDINDDEWGQSWDGRDEGVLLHSSPTVLFGILRETIAGKFHRGLASPVHAQLTLDLNIHPYNLDNNEREEIIQVIKEVTFTELEIRTVSIPPDRLTPLCIGENYQAVFMSDFKKWLSINNNLLVKNPIPKVTFYAPVIIEDGVDDLITRSNNEGINPVTTARQCMAEFLTLELLSASLFSLPPPPDLS